MKKKLLLIVSAFLLCFSLVLSSCGEEPIAEDCTTHIDDDGNNLCDVCGDKIKTNKPQPEDDPTEDKPTEDDPTEDDPTEDDPTEDKPTEDDPTEDDPTEDDPTEDDPTEDDPTEDDPTEDDPTEDDPTEDDPTEDDPTEDQPTEDTPTPDKPSDNQTEIDNPSSGGENNEVKKVTVTVLATAGVTVNGEDSVTVNVGDNVEFNIQISSSCDFLSVSHGSYDENTGKLTLEGVTGDTQIRVRVNNLGYDKNESCVYIFRGGSNDTSSADSLSDVNYGTYITVASNDSKHIFAGWSYGKNIAQGGSVASYDREFTFRLTPDITTDGALYLFANYKVADTYYIDANGGVVNGDTVNMQSNDYYSVVATSTRVKIQMLPAYFDYAKSASTFWDDGTFTREGYVLTEYNTKPDGTGDSYSIGSKFFPGGQNSSPFLYCIWKKASDASLFSYGTITMENPAKKASYAPDWRSEGLIIRTYIGDEETLVVPEYIDGKPVIAIAANAFINESFKTVVLPRSMQKVENGAFVGCSSLETLYFPSSMYEMYDEAFDAETYSNFKHLYVNATMAPRYTKSTEGAFAVKFSKFLETKNDKQIIIISGSSTYQSLGSEYMEALFSGEYSVINFGTTRPRPGTVYLEALSHYTNSDDIFIYAPENSAYMFGEKYLSWRMIRDLEGMNNLFRYVDISNYEGYFSSFTELNTTYSYTVEPRRYEDIAINGTDTYFTDKNGDYQNVNREMKGYENYIDSYYITLNNRVKSMSEALWNDAEAQDKDKDYTDPNNTTWISIDTPERIARLNMAINKAKASGARVYFGFAPVDANAVVDAARNTEWLAAYDKLIADIYDFDGLVGTSADYIFDHSYFYDCAFHTNDYGRTYRTYLMYVHICELLGIDNVKGIYDVGDVFDGCLFEEGSDGTPTTKVDYLNDPVHLGATEND